MGIALKKNRVGGKLTVPLLKPYFKETVTIKRLLDEARELKSEDGENPEYDRALCELIGAMLPGFTADNAATIAQYIRVKRGQDPLRVVLADVKGRLTVAGSRATQIVEAVKIALERVEEGMGL